MFKIIIHRCHHHHDNDPLSPHWAPPTGALYATIITIKGHWKHYLNDQIQCCLEGNIVCWENLSTGQGNPRQIFPNVENASFKDLVREKEEEIVSEEPRLGNLLRDIFMAPIVFYGRCKTLIRGKFVCQTVTYLIFVTAPRAVPV